MATAGSTTPARARRIPLVLAVAGTWLALDQLTKWWATTALDDRTIDLVWTLRFNLAFNTGGSFSLGDGFGPVIGVIAIGVVVLLLWMGRTVTHPVGVVALGLVLGGALGNLADRAFREGPGGFLGGAVVDFIDLQWWPIFNVADIGIVCGGIALAVLALREPAEDAAETDADAERP